MDKVDDLTAPKLINFMNGIVKELILITFNGLNKLNLDYENVSDAFFVENVMKNYVGNMILRGAENAKHFSQMSERFAKEFEDFTRIALKQLIKEDQLKEVH